MKTRKDKQNEIIGTVKSVDNLPREVFVDLDQSADIDINTLVFVIT